MWRCSKGKLTMPMYTRAQWNNLNLPDTTAEMDKLISERAILKSEYERQQKIFATFDGPIHGSSMAQRSVSAENKKAYYAAAQYLNLHIADTSMPSPSAGANYERIYFNDRSFGKTADEMVKRNPLWAAFPNKNEFNQMIPEGVSLAEWNWYVNATGGRTHTSLTALKFGVIVGGLIATAGIGAGALASASPAVVAAVKTGTDLKNKADALKEKAESVQSAVENKVAVLKESLPDIQPIEQIAKNIDSIFPTENATIKPLQATAAVTKSVEKPAIQEDWLSSLIGAIIDLFKG